MSSSLAITLDGKQQARLEALAKQRQATPADLAAEAVNQFLEDDAAFRSAVQVGLAAGRAGDVSDFADFAIDIRRRMAIKVSELEE